MNTITFPTAQYAVEKIAQEFVIYSQLNHPVHISLSGGSTPKLLFKTLAKALQKTSTEFVAKMNRTLNSNALRKN